ncbi:hypothetical protein NUW58_g3136 [Xylaria curta]|uniref:Uncharacterized protein n=2 Tax=Xylaria curta TaxID=42375 RepID=A0ACC1P8P2_9PEZI|nr:hypothetical protein NUW58_g4533 [Xylaria curta]KAJ2990075.1 hypothetical protein NUW58_g3136 [Xylaria curta]
MPPTKKTRAAATSRATKATRAKPRGNVLAERAENAQETSAQTRGIKRPASGDANAQEDQNAENNKPKTGRGRPRAPKAQKIAEPESEDELSEMHLETVALEPAKRGRKPRANVETEIPETQQPEIENLEAAGDSLRPYWRFDEIYKEGEQPDEQRQFFEEETSTAYKPRFIHGTASDPESNDLALRRRVEELTRKHETLEKNYRDLQEIGIHEAERNFDRLKKQSEERANTDKQLIATLKAQLVGETEAAKEAERLRSQLEDSQRKVEELQGKLEEAHDSLTEAKTEIKTLSTKLAAARSTESANMKVPGSAMKSTHANNRHMANAAEAAAQLAQKKENLYGDLTGLLVCGVKRENDEEVFDCVQTGRHGTLHFKLSIAIDGSSDKFEDAQFMYMPQLNAARDKELIDTLPDYLVEEITFPRLHAAKFYSRVVKALSERLD